MNKDMLPIYNAWCDIKQEVSCCIRDKDMNNASLIIKEFSRELNYKQINNFIDAWELATKLSIHGDTINTKIITRFLYDIWLEKSKKNNKRENPA